MTSVSPTRPATAVLMWMGLLAAIWLPVIYLLGAQWSLFAQYQYGWAVPFLCVYLAGQRQSSLPPATAPDAKRLAIFMLVAAGLAYWAMRVLLEANPLWRLASYGLAAAAMAMTWLVIYLTQGKQRAAHFIFPVAFFLMAVPWPTPVENVIIQSLTRFNANLVVETLGLVGVPALLHGNVIEISTGMVGIDEACSGIRSFQATLMLALFFGAYYPLRRGQRGWLLGAGPALALGFNFTRTLVLVLVAAQAGLPAMNRWHDPTGVTLLLACFFSLWGVALWLKPRAPGLAVKHPNQEIPATLLPLRPLMVGMIIWAAVVGSSTEAWFRGHEVRGDGRAAWTVRWPGMNPTLHTNILPQNSLRILQCDESASASWTGNEGAFWQAFYLRWRPADNFYGRAKEALSKFHNPADCLSASGMELRAQLDPVTLPVRPGFSLAFNRYVFAANDQTLYVFLRRPRTRPTRAKPARA